MQREGETDFTEPLSGIFIDCTQVLAALGNMMPSGQNTRVKGAGYNISPLEVRNIVNN